MRAGFLDFRVRREARGLVREARLAMLQKRGLRGKAGDLETVTKAMESALADDDRGRQRAELPALDALVDELVRRPAKSTIRDYVESIGAAVLIALALRAFVVEAFKIPSSSMYPTLEIGDHIFVNKFIYGVRIPFTMTKLFELRDPHRGEVIVFIYPCDPDRDYIKRVVATAGQTVEVRCGVLYVDGVAVPSSFVDDESYRDFSEQTQKWDSTLTPVSRYHETVGDKTYSVYASPRRRLRGTQEADERDFPRSLSEMPNCSMTTDAGKDISPQVFGKLVEDRPDSQAKVCEPRLHYVVPPGHIFAMGDNRNNSNDSRVWGSVPIDNVKGKALFIWLSYGDVKLNPLDSGIRFDRIGNFVQ